MCGALTGSTRSALFDGDGIELSEKTIIENGKVSSGYGDARYAYYLGEKPTGNLGCTKLSCGTLSDAELKSAPYVECVSLSGLQVDLYNDYVGGEIRLAYYFDGNETRPVTGISMSAKLSDVLAHLRLSDSTASVDGYEGPKKMLLKDVSIL
jgi:predicted Zn-dependent protease